MLRTLIIAAVLLVAAPAAASDATDIAAAVNAYNDTLNKNDLPGAAAYYTPAPTIIDEFTPHIWSGAGAFAQWGADYGVYAKDRGMTEGSMRLLKPRHVSVEGDRGYAVVPAIFDFERGGKQVHEAGIMTFAMQRIDGAWKIAGWAWTIK
jgi:ketosteroid isomerase-like protein